MTDATGTTTYTYDTLDRLTSKATPEGTLCYSYNAAGNLNSPVSSRFLTRDPFAGKRTDPKSLHKYLYASSNPVNALDPSGRFSFLEYGLVNEVELGRTQRAKYIGACAAVALRAVNYLFVDAGDFDTGIPHWNGPLGPLPLIATPVCLYGIFFGP